MVLHPPLRCISISSLKIDRGFHYPPGNKRSTYSCFTLSAFRPLPRAIEVPDRPPVNLGSALDYNMTLFVNAYQSIGVSTYEQKSGDACNAI